MPKKIKLSLSEVEKIVATKLRPQYPDVEFKVSKAKKTESIYVKIKYSGLTTITRLSDHHTKKEMQSLTVGKSTKVTFVTAFIESAIKRLKRKHTYLLFKEIEKLELGESRNDNSLSDEKGENSRIEGET